MLRIQIETQRGQLQLQSEKPQINLSIREPKLELNPENAKVEIKSTFGKFEIDQAPSRYGHGIRTYREFIEDFVRDSQQKGLEAIAKIASDGDRLARFETRRSAIAELAAESIVHSKKEVSVGTKERPYIRYHPGTLEIRATQPSLGARFTPGDVDNNNKWAKVDIRVNPRPSIRMWTKERRS